MNTYIVFALNVTLDAAPPDPLTTWALITQADDETQAVQKIVSAGMLPPAEQLHACDIANTQTYNVATSVTVEPTPTVQPQQFFGGEVLPSPEPTAAPVGDLLATPTNSTSAPASDATAT